MKFHLTECVAIGVSDAEAAAQFYHQVLGWSEVKRASNWIEMQTGAIRLFLCEDEQTTPTFDLQCSDPAAGLEYLLARGFNQVMVETGDEAFVRDPYGNMYVISKD